MYTDLGRPGVHLRFAGDQEIMLYLANYIDIEHL